MLEPDSKREYGSARVRCHEPEPAAMHRGGPFRDGEPETASAGRRRSMLRPRSRGIGAVEPIGDMRLRLGRDAATSVLYAEGDPAPVLFGTDADQTIIIRVLD